MRYGLVYSAQKQLYTSFTVLHGKAKAESEDEHETSCFTIACSHSINMELSNNLGND